MRVVRHFSQHTPEIFLVNERQESIASLLISRDIPRYRNEKRKQRAERQFPNDAPEIRSTIKQKQSHDKYGQNDANGTFGERRQTHAQYSPPRQSTQIALVPAVKQKHSANNERRQHHIYAAIHASPMHLERRQRKQTRKQRNVIAASARKTNVESTSKTNATADGSRDVASLTCPCGNEKSAIHQWKKGGL